MKDTEDKSKNWIGRTIDKITGSTPFDFAQDNDGESIESIRSSFDFVLKNLRFLVFSLILLVVYINNRMVCEKQFSEIDKLNKELTDIKYVSMITEAELLKTGRPEIIKELVGRNGLGLVELDCPPYKVVYKEQ